MFAARDPEPAVNQGAASGKCACSPSVILERMQVTFLDRYRAGEREAVWDDLTALGPAVRHELYLTDATKVARETMQRARRNVELLIERLRAMGYHFLTQENSEALQDAGLRRLHNLAHQAAAGAQASEFARQQIAKSFAKPNVPLQPPDKKTAGALKRLEKIAGGPLPLSLRAWYEEVGAVSLIGWHSVLHPNPDEPGASQYPPDPLVMEPLELLLELAQQEGVDGEFALWLSPDDLTKAHTSGGDPYSIPIPNPSADAPFDDGNGRTFVNYLRHVFEWGGFPGWKCGPNPPREALASLTNGLLAI